MMAFDVLPLDSIALDKYLLEFWSGWVYCVNFLKFFIFWFFCCVAAGKNGFLGEKR